MNFRALLAGLMLLAVTSTRPAGCAEGPAPKSGDTACASFDELVNVFEAKGPHGAIVKAGTDRQPDGIRFGAAAYIGVSPDSYGKFRFEMYMIIRDEAGQIVQDYAHLITSDFGKDGYKWGVVNTHDNPKPGTYTITFILAAIAMDDSEMTILDQGKTATYTVK